MKTKKADSDLCNRMLAPRSSAPFLMPCTALREVNFGNLRANLQVTDARQSAA